VSATDTVETGTQSIEQRTRRKRASRPRYARVRHRASRVSVRRTDAWRASRHPTRFWAGDDRGDRRLACLLRHARECSSHHATARPTHLAPRVADRRCAPSAVIREESSTDRPRSPLSVLRVNVARRVSIQGVFHRTSSIGVAPLRRGARDVDPDPCDLLASIEGSRFPHPGPARSRAPCGPRLIDCAGVADARHLAVPCTTSVRLAARVRRWVTPISRLRRRDPRSGVGSSVRVSPRDRLARRCDAPVSLGVACHGRDVVVRLLLLRRSWARTIESVVLAQPLPRGRATEPRRMMKCDAECRGVP
jgi:hypothetical protein